MHPSFLFSYTVVFFLWGAFFHRIAFFSSGDILGYATDITAERILELVNAERAKVGAGPLDFSLELRDASLKKASDMFQHNYWAHTSPTGVSPWQFITQAGYSYIYAGENLAKNFDTSEEVVAAWMRSPTHRANILKLEYRDIGLAVMNGSLLGQDTTLVVQEFGSREQIAEVPPVSSQGYAAHEGVPEQMVQLPVPPVLIGQTQIAGDEKIDQSPSLSLRDRSLASRIFLFAKGSDSAVLKMKNLAFFTVEAFLLVLFVDVIYMWRHQPVRISSHSIAHIIFFLCLFGAISIGSIGAIL